MATTPIVITLPIQNRSGSDATGTQQLPAGYSEIVFSLNVPVTGVSQPYNQVGMAISYEVDVSYDGGATWQLLIAGTFGQPPYSRGAPGIAIGIPQTPYPTHFRGFTSIAGGPISFGGSLTIK